MTLHVGAGTFLPVKADDTVDHKMHAEWGRIDAATAPLAIAAGADVLVAGTATFKGGPAAYADNIKRLRG